MISLKIAEDTDFPENREKCPADLRGWIREHVRNLYVP